METENRGNYGEKQEEIKVANKRSVNGSEVFLRFLALILTLVAAIVGGVNKQTKVVPLVLVPTLPPVNLPVSAKFNYMSAFVYFVVANAIACSYATATLLLSLADMCGKKGLSLLIIILDLAVVALLFSGNGAATAVGVLGYHGNSHVRWNKVCNVFDKFCNQLAGAIVVSLLGSLAFFVLVVLAALNLHKKSK
ncbi:hypothetical protein LguiA_031164 [Lonicera macranthoides]